MPKTISDKIVRLLWKYMDEDDYAPLDAIHTFLHEVAEQCIDADVKMQLDLARDAMYDVLSALGE